MPQKKTGKKTTRTTRYSGSSRTTRRSSKKPKVYIPAYKVIILCCTIITICMALLLITNLKETDSKYFDEIVQFANDIRMVALPVLKEKNGYLLNSMLVPFLLSGLDLYVNGVSDPASIDKAWKYGTGAPRGPFEIFDVVGINTAYHIVMQYQKVPGLISPLLKKMLMPYNFKGMEKVLKKYLDEGKLGKAAGEGFYKYN